MESFMEGVHGIVYELCVYRALHMYADVVGRYFLVLFFNSFDTYILKEFVFQE